MQAELEKSAECLLELYWLHVTETQPQRLLQIWICLFLFIGSSLQLTDSLVVVCELSSFGTQA